MDLVVEKATELGVSRIVPLCTERSFVRLSEGDRKARRWHRVAEAAARQSLRLRIPEVSKIVSFSEGAHKAGETGVLLHNEAELPPLEDVVPGPVVGVFVGPEGGFGDGELATARERRSGLTGCVPRRRGWWRWRVPAPLWSVL